MGTAVNEARESTAPVSADGPAVLDRVECRSLLTRMGWGLLSTASEDGTPYAVPVSYALGRDCVYVASGPGLKRANLDANPRACLTVCDVESGERWRTVVIRGDAIPVEGLTEHTVAMAAFVSQRGPSRMPAVRDATRLFGARIWWLPLSAMTGRSRGHDA
jgi:nitroimidazol reductase NimA-like FMN-containing flavoprotein (pyridoxamine 5'-phosphate oxidase superfamily)